MVSRSVPGGHCRGKRRRPPDRGLGRARQYIASTHVFPAVVDAERTASYQYRMNVTEKMKFPLSSLWQRGTEGILKGAGCRRVMPLHRYWHIDLEPRSRDRVSAEHHSVTITYIEVAL
jgi:hypothetical protein